MSGTDVLADKPPRNNPLGWGRPSSRPSSVVIAADPLISAQGLSKSYSGTGQVIEGVSLNIAEGEAVALIGANGAGKSTLLKCLIGLHPNGSGSVTVLGETFKTSPTSTQNSNIRRQIGFVFQSHGLVKRMSAHSNVIHGLFGRPGSWHGFCRHLASEKWRHQAFESLEAVELAHKADARVGALSGGQAQRVAIARALVRKPRLFVADEPAASLDPASGHAVMQQFLDLARRLGITLLFTSHDMEHAVRYADRVIALKNGTIHFDEASDSLRESEIEAVFR